MGTSIIGRRTISCPPRAHARSTRCGGYELCVGHEELEVGSGARNQPAYRSALSPPHRAFACASLVSVLGGEAACLQRRRDRPLPCDGRSHQERRLEAFDGERYDVHYDRADLLPRAIESVRAHTYPHMEHTVVDDGSTNSTDDVPAMFQGIVRQPNSGQPAAMDRGLREARGAVVAVVDSDDYWNPEHLAHSVRAMESGQMAFVFSIDGSPDEGRSPNDLRALVCLSQYSAGPISGGWMGIESEETRRLFIDNNPACISSLVFSHAALRSCWVDGIKMAADRFAVLGCILDGQGAACASHPEPSWIKFAHGANMYNGNDTSPGKSRAEIHDRRRILDRWGGVLMARETASIDRQIRACLLDLAYPLGREGQALSAIAACAEAFRIRPSGDAVSRAVTVGLKGAIRAIGPKSREARTARG